MPKNAGHVSSLCLILSAVWIAAAHADGPLPPRNLRCEYAANPIGLDVRQPRLSWELHDNRRGVTQSAYQVLVGDTVEDVKTGKGAVWDSGKTASDCSIHVVHGGPALESRQRCYWTVRTWDRDDNPSPYAEPASWEMALLDSSEWQARWITPAAEDKAGDVPVGSWIWHEDKDQRKRRVFLRKTFEIEAAPVASATIRITADDAFTLCVNGKEIGRDKEWKSIEDYDVTDALRPGKNVAAAAAVAARNREKPCGLLFGLHVRYEDGRTADVLSGGDWLSADVVGVAGKDWSAPECDTSRWKKASVVAEYGGGPWGRVNTPALSRAACMRKDFLLDADVAKARVYVSGLGLYELHLNGQRVGEDVFAPGWTHYTKRVMYQTYDVTALLRPGGNAVGAILGNGWWGQNMAGTWHDGNVRFIMQLEVEDTQGDRRVIATDASWKTHEAPIVEDSFYNGEMHDAQLEMPGWDTPEFDASEWQAVKTWDEPLGRLAAQVGPPIRVTEELEAVSVTEPLPGVYVYDFGQNASGRARLKVSGPRGTRIQIRFAEVLKPDGNIYTDNYRSARATDVYVLKGGGEEVWEPRFTYRGFRYAELTGYPSAPPKDALTARVLHSAPPMAGTFECSHELINRIHGNIVWGQRSNLHSVPTDCPQRDERLGWTGDVQCFAPTSCWNMEMAAFYAKWMRDLGDSQHEDGGVTDVVPGLWDPPGSPAWGDVVTVVPWTVYQFYGDTRIIEETYDSMAAWINHMRNADNDGGLFVRQGHGDWVSVENSPNKPIAGAYQYHSTNLLANMAQAIGRGTDAETYREQARAIAGEFNKRYFYTDTNSYRGGTQTANLLPLYFGITPEDRREAVARNLVQDIVDHTCHLTTGFLGTAYLMPVLTGMGHHDVAGRLAVQRTYPSWGYMVDNGATTIWERWNSNRIEEVGAGMNSFNHFCLGAVGQWFFEALAGINPAEPGFKRIVIRPRPFNGLVWAKASYPSMYGLIRSGWRIDSGKFVMEIEIPHNTSALVYVPAADAGVVTEGGRPAAQSEAVTFLRQQDGAAVYEVGSGAYRFEARIAQ